MTLTRLESFPFDSRSDGYDDEGYPVYDRAVGAGTLREVFKKMFSNGVMPTPADAFAITEASGLTVKVNPGIAIIEGAMGGFADDAVTLALDKEPPKGKTAYSVMLRYDGNDEYRSLYLRVVKGEPSSNPAPPEPEIGPGVQELRLGYVVVPSGATDMSEAVITNEKGLACCPYAAPFDKVDLSAVVDSAKVSAQRALQKLRERIVADIGLLDAALDDTAAGHLQTQIDHFDDKVAGSVEEAIPVLMPKLVDDKSLAYEDHGDGTQQLAVKDGYVSPKSFTGVLPVEKGGTGKTGPVFDLYSSAYAFAMGIDTVSSYYDCAAATGSGVYKEAIHIESDGAAVIFTGLTIASGTTVASSSIIAIDSRGIATTYSVSCDIPLLTNYVTRSAAAARVDGAVDCLLVLGPTAGSSQIDGKSQASSVIVRARLTDDGVATLNYLGKIDMATGNSRLTLTSSGVTRPSRDGARWVFYGMEVSDGSTYFAPKIGSVTDDGVVGSIDALVRAGVPKNYDEFVFHARRIWYHSNSLYNDIAVSVDIDNAVVASYGGSGIGIASFPYLRQIQPLSDTFCYYSANITSGGEPPYVYRYAYILDSATGTALRSPKHNTRLMSLGGFPVAPASNTTDVEGFFDGMRVVIYPKDQNNGGYLSVIDEVNDLVISRYGDAAQLGSYLRPTRAIFSDDGSIVKYSIGPGRVYWSKITPKRGR